MHVVRVFFRVHQIVLTAPHETEEIMEKLADIRRSHEVVQVQLGDAPTQINPKILVVEHIELLPISAEEIVAICKPDTSVPRSPSRTRSRISWTAFFV